MSDHAHHHHGHTHSHAVAAPVGFSLLRLSVGQRLAGVLVMLVVLWAAVIAAVAS